jgi:hypothetical protein
MYVIDRYYLMWLCRIFPQLSRQWHRFREKYFRFQMRIFILSFITYLNLFIISGRIQPDIILKYSGVHVKNLLFLFDFKLETSVF